MADAESLIDEVHVTSYLDQGGSSGPAKSMPTGPYYSIMSLDQSFSLESQADGRPYRFRYEDDPLAYSRFPTDLAPPGIFEHGYYSPTTLYSTRYFSTSVPRDVFLKECATYVQNHLSILIDREYKKWGSMGKLPTFMYFAATFGLGEIRPSSNAVRLLLIAQIVLGVVMTTIAIPGVVSLIQRRVAQGDDTASN